jgi:hypothetical protein
VESWVARGDDWQRCVRWWAATGRRGADRCRDRFPSFVFGMDLAAFLRDVAMADCVSYMFAYAADARELRDRIRGLAMLAGVEPEAVRWRMARGAR